MTGRRRETDKTHSRRPTAASLRAGVKDIGRSSLFVMIFDLGFWLKRVYRSDHPNIAGPICAGNERPLRDLHKERPRSRKFSRSLG